MRFTTDEVRDLLTQADRLTILNDYIYKATPAKQVSMYFDFRGIRFEMSLDTDIDSEVYLGVENADVRTAIYNNGMMLDLIEEIYQESLK